VLSLSSGTHDSSLQLRISGHLRGSRLITLGDIAASLRDVLWLTWSEPLSWSTVLWAALGLMAGCVVMLIAMSVNMHYRLQRSFAVTRTETSDSAQLPVAATVSAAALHPVEHIANADIKISL
jgi:hypothetical protein